MISLDQIKQFYPDEKNISERNMLREYLQYKMLDIVFSTKYASKLSFKGGTAIRIIYGNDRFSEDLDFDHKNLNKKEFKQITTIVKKSLQKEGLEVEVKNVYRETYRCYLKFVGLLFDYGLSRHEEEKILIQLDSRPEEDFELQSELKVINKFGIFAEIRVNPVGIILAQKINALLTRRRILGRDLYDLIYLSSLTESNRAYLKQKHNLTKQENVKAAIEKRIISYNKERLAADIEPFISDRDKLEVVRKFDHWLSDWEFWG